MNEFIKSCNWSILSSVFGSSHSSIIGFISAEWIRTYPEGIVMDGEPSPFVGEGRMGQVNSDLLLIRSDNIKAVVEVETTRWREKVESLALYLNDPKYAGAEGLLVLTTVKGVVNSNERPEISSAHAARINETKSKILETDKLIHLVQLIRTEWKDQPTPQMLHMLELRDTYYYRYRMHEVRHWNPSQPDLEPVLYRLPGSIV